jgi:hypothetical protein
MAGLANDLFGDAEGWDLVGQTSLTLFGFFATALLLASVSVAVGPFLGAVSEPLLRAL